MGKLVINDDNIYESFRDKFLSSLTVDPPKNKMKKGLRIDFHVLEPTLECAVSLSGVGNSGQFTSSALSKKAFLPAVVEWEQLLGKYQQGRSFYGWSIGETGKMSLTYKDEISQFGIHRLAFLPSVLDALTFSLDYRDPKRVEEREDKGIKVSVNNPRNVYWQDALARAIKLSRGEE
ncbi:hypothetical protein D3C74_49030 [compost metagenome]